MFGLLTKKKSDERITRLLKQIESESWDWGNELSVEQDRLDAKLRDLQERVAILEDRHLGGLMTPKEVDEKMQKRVDANRYARSQYRKRKEKTQEAKRQAKT
jgi:hypothetical protein